MGWGGGGILALTDMNFVRQKSGFFYFILLVDHTKSHIINYSPSFLLYPR